MVRGARFLRRTEAFAAAHYLLPGTRSCPGATSRPIPHPDSGVNRYLPELVIVGALSAGAPLRSVSLVGEDETRYLMS